MSTPTGHNTHIAAAILAGGDSRRMGTNKSLLVMDGKPLIQHIANRLQPVFETRLVSANEVEQYAFLGLPVVPDQIPGQGPLQALVSLLQHTKLKQVFVIACDMPWWGQNDLERLIHAAGKIGCVVPMNAQGRHEPLFAIYHQEQLSTAQALLAEGKRSMMDLVRASPVKYIELRTPPPNLNTPAEFDAFLHNRQGEAP